MNEDRVVRLKAEIEAYPYDSDARISVAEALLANSTDKELVNQQLMEDALFMPSRVVLYFLMHGAEEKVSAELNSVAHGSEAQSGKQSAERSGAQDRTVSLIDSYLAENPAEKPRRKLTLADASTDYASWLEQNDKDEAGENTIQSVETDVTVNVDDPAEPMMGVCEEIDMLTLWSVEGSSAYAIPSCAPTEGGRTVSVPSIAMNITRARQLITAVNGRSLRFIVEIFAFWRT